MSFKAYWKVGRTPEKIVNQLPVGGLEIAMIYSSCYESADCNEQVPGDYDQTPRDDNQISRNHDQISRNYNQMPVKSQLKLKKSYNQVPRESWSGAKTNPKKVGLCLKHVPWPSFSMAISATAPVT